MGLVVTTPGPLAEPPGMSMETSNQAAEGPGACAEWAEAFLLSLPPDSPWFLGFSLEGGEVPPTSLVGAITGLGLAVLCLQLAV